MTDGMLLRESTLDPLMKRWVVCYNKSSPDETVPSEGANVELNQLTVSVIVLRIALKLKVPFCVVTLLWCW